MANYSNLKAAINAVIKQNGQGEITGEVMNQVLTAMVNSLGSNYMFAGVATPSTNPGTPDQNVFYMATQAGTYTNFNAIVLQAGISILLWNGSWSSETFFEIDSVPTSGSGNFISSGAVFDKFKLDGGAYDVSAHNNNQTFASLSELLNDANLSTLIPTNIRRGGMSIKFVQSSDNKYIQARLMSQSFTTDIDSWQVIDDAIKAGSKDIARSGDVAENLKSIQKTELAITGHGKYIDLSGGVGTEAQIDTPTALALYKYILYPVTEGDIVTINGSGGRGPRLWAFIDSSNIILQVAEENASGNEIVKIAPQNAAYVIINNSRSTNDTCYIESGNSIRQDFLNYKKNEIVLGGINLSLADEVAVVIGGTGKWAAYSDFKSIAIPIAPSSNYRIASGNYSCGYCFLTEKPTYVIGDEVPFAEGYSSVLYIVHAESKTIVSPVNARYLYLLSFGDGQVRLPQSVDSVSHFIDTDDEPTENSDAYVTSGTVYNVKKEVGKFEIPLIGGYYINLSGGVGSVAPIDSPTELADYSYGIYPCSEGDYVEISGLGGASPRLWAFLDSSNVIIQVASANVSANNLLLKVPTNTAKLVINTSRTAKSFWYNQDGLNNKLISLENEFSSKTIVDYSSIAESPKMISSADKWVTISVLYKSKFVEVSGGQELIIYNNCDARTSFALVSSIGEDGDDVDYATGYSSIVGIAVGEYAVVQVPNDAHYLFTPVNMNGSTRSIEVTIYEAKDKLSTSSIIDNCSTLLPDAPLSAKQGVVLRNKANGPRKVYVAASDSPDEEKLMADYQCTGTNDELVIQAAIDSLKYGGTVQLLDGTFNIDSFPYSVNVYDDKTQTTTHIEHVAIYFKDVNNGGARTVNIIGSTENKSYNSTYGTNIRVSDAAIGAMNNTDIYACFMGTPVHPTQYGTYTWVTNANFENFKLYINDAQKKIIGINCMFFGGTRMKIVSIGTKSTIENRFNHRPPVTPAIGSIGIVMNSGSNDAADCGFESVFCGGMYIGFMFHDVYYGASLDHLVMINCGVSQCVYGFYFKSGTDKTLTLINCSDEACTHLPYFGGRGHITAIDTCIERFNSVYYPEDLAGSTEFYAQEETPSSWIGTIEFTLQGWSGADEGLTGQHFWKDGQGHGIRTRNLNYDHKGYTQPNRGEYLEQYFDRTTNKWMTWNGTSWV